MILVSFRKKTAGILTLLGLVMGGMSLFTPAAQAAPIILPDSLPNGRVGVAYQQTVRLNTDTAMVWSEFGELPPGIVQTVTSGGTASLIKGTPTTPGSYPFTVVASEPYSLSAGLTRDYTLVILPMEIEQSTLPRPMVGTAYSFPLTVLGGTAPFEWSVISGALPTGLTLNVGTGVISGTPTSNSTYSATIRAKDANGLSASKPFTFIVDAAPVLPLEIYTGSTLASGRVGSSYNADLLAGGGVAPYRWNMLTGSTLPSGLTLTSSAGGVGQLRGTPTASGSYTFSVKLLDSRDASLTKTFTLSVSPAVTIPDPFTGPALTITASGSAPNGTVGTNYSTALTASGGTAPYRWNFASGTLPPGLTLSADGYISGRPTTAGNYTAYIEVFDARGTFVGRNINIAIASPVFVPGPSFPGGSIPTPSIELTNRLNTLIAQGISVHALVKLPDDGNRFTQADSAVYYIGADGRRHAFPNDRVFFTWYGSFDSVRVVSPTALASIPLGANATYKPGVKMVKFTTDPKVYAVSSNRTLRWVKTEGAAQALYGSNWNRSIDDIADTFYLDYNFGADVNVASDYDRNGLQSAIRFVSDVLPL